MPKVHIPEVLPPETKTTALARRNVRADRDEAAEELRAQRREALEQIRFATEALGEILSLFSEPKPKAKKRRRRK